jgi:hypothetical protein
MTGLTWERSASSATYTQAQAAAYCAANRIGGFSNWRLPTVIELVSIVDFSVSDPSINSTAFPSTPSNYFWTSSPFVGSVGRDWVIRFINGTTIDSDDAVPSQVRCVR